MLRLCGKQLWMPCGAGDQAAHLMWRLRNGQLYTQSQPGLIVIMIGTNDLGAAACLGGYSGIKKSAKGAAERHATIPSVPLTPAKKTIMKSIIQHNVRLLAQGFPPRSSRPAPLRCIFVKACRDHCP